MFFVSSILVSEDFMWRVTKMFEGYFLFGKAYPGIVSVSCSGSSWSSSPRVPRGAQAPDQLPPVAGLPRPHEDHAARGHDAVVVQAVTGFMLFFLVTVHLYQMLMHPGDIDPTNPRTGSGPPLVAAVPGDAVRRRAARGHRPLPPRGQWGWFEGSDRTRRGPCSRA